MSLNVTAITSGVYSNYQNLMLLANPQSDLNLDAWFSVKRIFLKKDEKFRVFNL